MELVNANLPEYITKCLVVAGYNTLPVIATIDEQGDTLKEIEDYINSMLPNTKEYHINDSDVCRFSPGYQRQISSFVDEVKQIVKASHQTSSKKRERKVSKKVASKRFKPDDDDNGQCSSKEAALDDVVRDIRYLILKWQRQEKCEKNLKTLKENEHYEILVKRKGTSFCSIIKCNLCQKNLSLGMKDNKPMISNWSRHIAVCIKRRHGTSGTLQAYFSPSTSSSTHTNTLTPHSYSVSAPTVTENLIDSSSSLDSSLVEALQPFQLAGACSQKVQSFRLSPPIVREGEINM